MKFIGVILDPHMSIEFIHTITVVSVGSGDLSGDKTVEVKLLLGSTQGKGAEYSGDQPMSGDATVLLPHETFGGVAKKVFSGLDRIRAEGHGQSMQDLLISLGLEIRGREHWEIGRSVIGPVEPDVFTKVKTALQRLGINEDPHELS